MPRVLICVLSILILSSACQAAQYSIVPLGGMPWGSRAEFINDGSQIAGVDFQTGYFLHESTVSSFAFPSTLIWLELKGMSESGIVVGIANSGESTLRGGFVSMGGQAPSYLPFYPNGITETDTIVGIAEVMDYSTGVVMPANDWLGIDNHIWSVYDANDAKQAVGYDAVDPDNPQLTVWDGLTMHSLTLLPNERLEKAYINTIGQVVAAIERYDSTTGFSHRSFYWDASQGFLALDGVQHPSNLPLKSVNARGISNKGQIVGTAVFESGNTTANKNFTWSATGGYSWLPDEYIPFDVNSDGLIVANYGNGSALLVPVPEPGGLKIIALGLLGVALRLRKIRAYSLFLLICTAPAQATSYNAFPVGLETFEYGATYQINDARTIAGTVGDIEIFYKPLDGPTRRFSVVTYDTGREILTEDGFYVFHTYDWKTYFTRDGESIQPTPYHAIKVTKLGLLYDNNYVLDLKTNSLFQMSDYLGVSIAGYKVDAISDSGHAVLYTNDPKGWKYYYYNGSSISEVGIDPSDTKILEMNIQGQATGIVNNDGFSYFFVDTDGSVTTIGFEGFEYSIYAYYVNGFNNQGDVVGRISYIDGSLPGSCGFLWNKQTGIQYFHDYSSILDINNNGIMLATTFTDNDRFYWLVPVPEPGGMLVMAGGLLGLLAVMRRKV